MTAAFSDGGRPSGGQCLAHSSSVGGGVWVQVGEVSRADEVVCGLSKERGL